MLLLLSNRLTAILFSIPNQQNTTEKRLNDLRKVQFVVTY